MKQHRQLTFRAIVMLPSPERQRELDACGMREPDRACRLCGQPVYVIGLAFMAARNRDGSAHLC